MPSSKVLHADLRVLIVGAGVAGLSLANALIQEGVQPTVVDISSDAFYRGVGMKIWPNALLALRTIGLDEAVINAGQQQTKAYYMNQAGELLSIADLTPKAVTNPPHLSIGRPALIEAIRPPTGADIRTGLTIVSLEQSDIEVDVRFSDDSTEKYDLVIGADGLNSRIRSLLFMDSEPEYLGINAWRALVALAPTDEQQPQIREADGYSGITFAVSQTQLYVSLLSRGHVKRGASSEEHFQYFKDLCERFAAPLPSFPSRIENPEQIVFNPVHEVRLENWHVGRVALVGDAAHAMPPFWAQGASMAFEDVAVLFHAMKQFSTHQQAFAHYESRRQPRLRKIRKIVTANGATHGLLLPDNEEEMALYKKLLADREEIREVILGFSVG